MKSNVEKQANEMGNFLRKGEIDKYLDNMAHFVYVNDEERAQLKKNIQEQLDFMKERDNDITKIQSIVNSGIYENGGYYQCVVKQVADVTNNYTVYNTKTYLMAVSTDGEKWKFADVTNLSDKILRAVFPEMHPDLKIVKDEDQPIEKQ